jgi:hypothetical protein
VWGFFGNAGLRANARSLRNSVARSARSPARIIAVVLGFGFVLSPRANFAFCKFCSARMMKPFPSDGSVSAFSLARLSAVLASAARQALRSFAMGVWHQRIVPAQQGSIHGYKLQTLTSHPKELTEPTPGFTLT